MTVDMTWDDPQQTIMLCKSHGKWTWDEYHATLSQIVEHFKQVTYRVDLVITRKADASMPSGSPMPHFQRAMRIMPEHVGLVVLVNTGGFARALVSMFSKLFAAKSTPRLIVVGSLEEAREKIAKHRAEDMVLEPVRSRK